MEKNIIGNKRSTLVNRVSDDCFVIVVVPIHFCNYIGSPASIHYVSDGEFKVAIIWIEFSNSLACRFSVAKKKIPALLYV